MFLPKICPINVNTINPNITYNKIGTKSIAISILSSLCFN